MEKVLGWMVLLWNFINFFGMTSAPFLVRSINFSYSIGEMWVSQRSAIITTLPKPNNTKFYLKYWRPISLLGVDSFSCHRKTY